MSLKPLKTLTEENLVEIHEQQQWSATGSDMLELRTMTVEILLTELTAQRTEPTVDGERGEMLAAAHVMLMAWEDTLATDLTEALVGTRGIEIMQQRLQILHWLLSREQRLHEMECVEPMGPIPGERVKLHPMDDAEMVEYVSNREFTINSTSLDEYSVPQLSAYLRSEKSRLLKLRRYVAARKLRETQ